MNPDWLLKHFGQISEAPDAVPRLRRFILDLAVRGKLVEQNPADEPASELLKRIRAEKQEHAGRRSCTEQRPFEVDETETPFEIPESWEWVKATEPAVVISDKGKKVQTKDVLEFGEFPVVDQGKVLIRGYCNDVQKVTRVSGPIIVFGDHTRETKLIDFDFVVGADGVKLLKPIEVNPAYYFLALQWVPLDSRGYARHFKLLRASRFPLPPLAEQHRIVAKVDELMALCDELEAAQVKRERRRDRLVAATLHGLNNGDDSSEPGGHPIFEESARFYFKHLPRLTTRPEHIQKLRQTILNLAVRGKLVWQDTKQQALTVESLEVPFYLPASWRWKTIGDLGKTQTGSTPPTVERQHYDGNIPFIKPAAISDGVINYEGQCLTESGVRESTLVHAGAILMVCIGGSIGKAALVTRSVCFNQQINSVSPTEGIDAHYLLFAMQSPYFGACVVNAAAQGTLPIISKGKWERLLIPVPPLAEQHRIVAKVDELMALCDRLEARITTTATTRHQLLEATLSEAIA